MPVTFTSKAAAPTGLSLDTTVAGEITATWTDNSSGEDGYYVYLSSDGTNFSRVGTKGANTTQHTETSLSDSAKYWIYISSHVANKETNSSTVTGITVTFEQASSVNNTLLSNNEVSTGLEDATSVVSSSVDEVTAYSTSNAVAKLDVSELFTLLELVDGAQSEESGIQLNINSSKNFSSRADEKTSLSVDIIPKQLAKESGTGVETTSFVPITYFSQLWDEVKLMYSATESSNNHVSYSNPNNNSEVTYKDL